MKKVIKKIGKCLIIYVILIMTVLSTVCYGYTQEEVGSAVAGFAKHLCETHSTSHYGEGGDLQYYLGSHRIENPFWNPRYAQTYANPPWIFDCSSFVTAMYNYVCGMFVLGSDSWPATTGTISSSSNLERVGKLSDMKSQLQPGDILCYDVGGNGHTEIFISPEDGTAGAHGNNNQYVYGVSVLGGGQIRPTHSATYVYRVNQQTLDQITNLNTEFSLAGVGGSSKKKNINFSKFYFSGIPDGKYSIAYSNIFDIIVDTFMNLVDYLIGILTYLTRVVFVGFTAIMDNLLNVTIKAITDVNVDSSAIDMNKVEVEGVEEEDRDLTIESILFNEFDLFDVNIFDIEEGGNN